MFLFGPPNIDKLRTEGNIDKLAKILRSDKRKDLQQEAVLALGQILAENGFAGSRARDTLIEGLEDPNTTKDLFRLIFDTLLLSKNGSNALMEYLYESFDFNKRSYISESARDKIIQLLTQSTNHVDLFYALLKRPFKSRVHAIAIEALSKIGDKKAIPIITQYLSPIYFQYKYAKQHDFEFVTNTAKEALSRYGDEALGLVFNMLSNDEPKTRNAAADCLASYLHWQPKDISEHLLFLIAQDKLDEAAKLDEDVNSELIKLLKDSSKKGIRLQIIETLAKTGDPKIVTPLATIIKAKTNSPEIRATAIETVIKISETTGDPKIIKSLKTVIEDGEIPPSIRKTAIETIIKTLAKTGDPELAIGLVSAIEDKTTSSAIKKTAIEAIGTIGFSKNSKVNDAVAGELQTSNKLVAAITLGRIGDNRASKILIDELRRNENIEKQHVDNEKIVQLTDATYKLLDFSCSSLDLEDVERLARLENLKIIANDFIITSETPEEDEYGRYTKTDGYWSKTIISTVDMSLIREAAQKELAKRQKSKG